MPRRRRVYEKHRTMRSFEPTFKPPPVPIPNTHYSVVLRCLHRHLEQKSIGCLLSAHGQPCRRCVSVVALTRGGLYVGLGLAESVVTYRTSHRSAAPQMGGYLLTYAL